MSLVKEPMYAIPNQYSASEEEKMRGVEIC